MMPARDPRQPIPLKLVTGYLGAGKTTLVNRILSEDQGLRFAVVVNEFGEIGVDGALLAATAGSDSVFEMANGCVCCAVSGELADTLAGILARPETFDAVLLETSGLADPAPIVHALMADPALSGRIRLDGVITVADAVTLSADRPLATEEAAQIAMADLVVLNKSSDVPDVAPIEARLRAVNPHARHVRTDRSAVSLDQILNLGALHDAADGHPAGPSGTGAGHAAGHHHHGEHHDHEVGIVSVSLAVPGTIDLASFMEFLDSLVAETGAGLLRLKGILRIEGEPRPFLVQGVRTVIDGSFTDLTDVRNSRLVVIGHHLDAADLRSRFAACEAGAAA